ncbi:hypothetical protein JKY72_02945 [Candidatus Gracilibacteria bacterium]|nr:hypothetical protein [Candidatus Gracilibacteria bacterium]
MENPDRSNSPEELKAKITELLGKNVVTFQKRKFTIGMGAHAQRVPLIFTITPEVFQNGPQDDFYFQAVLMPNGTVNFTTGNKENLEFFLENCS